MLTGPNSDKRVRTNPHSHREIMLWSSFMDATILASVHLFSEDTVSLSRSRSTRLEVSDQYGQVDLDLLRRYEPGYALSTIGPHRSSKNIHHRSCVSTASWYAAETRRNEMYDYSSTSAVDEVRKIGMHVRRGIDRDGPQTFSAKGRTRLIRTLRP